MNSEEQHLELKRNSNGLSALDWFSILIVGLASLAVIMVLIADQEMVVEVLQSAGDIFRDSSK